MNPPADTTNSIVQKIKVGGKTPLRQIGNTTETSVIANLVASANKWVISSLVKILLALMREHATWASLLIPAGQATAGSTEVKTNQTWLNTRTVYLLFRIKISSKAWWSKKSSGTQTWTDRRFTTTGLGITTLMAWITWMIHVLQQAAMMFIMKVVQKIKPSPNWITKPAFLSKVIRTSVVKNIVWCGSPMALKSNRMVLKNGNGAMNFALDMKKNTKPFMIIMTICMNMKDANVVIVMKNLTCKIRLLTLLLASLISSLARSALSKTWSVNPVVTAQNTRPSLVAVWTESQMALLMPLTVSGTTRTLLRSLKLRSERLVLSVARMIWRFSLSQSPPLRCLRLTSLKKLRREVIRNGLETGSTHSLALHLHLVTETPSQALILIG